MANESSSTVTNQINPVGSNYESKRSAVFISQKDGGLFGKDKKIFTSTRLTKTTNNPPTYRKEVFQHSSASGGSSTQIGTVVDGKLELNAAAEIGNAVSEDSFRLQVEAQIKNQTKDAEKQIKKKINTDTQAINKNQGKVVDDDSTDSTKTKVAPNKGIARKNYGTMFYPSFIQKSDQDKLKITILEFSSRFEGGKKTGNFKADYNSQSTKGNRGKSAAKGRTKNKNSQKGINLAQSDGSAFSLDNNKRIEVNKRTLGHIILPIPDGVTDQNKVDFGSGTLNPLQVAGSEFALNFLLKGIGEAGKTAADVFKQTATDKNIQTALATLLTSTGLGVDNDQLLARTKGNIVNNNLELLFKGPTLRPFQFSFNLSPRDGVEARQVQKIIRALKQSSSVQRTPGGLFLATPNTYKLEFKNGRTNRTHEFLPRIKECALVNVSVNYMPENMYMTYNDSSMVAYKVDLAFQELEPIFNDDYEDNDGEQTGMISMPGNPNTGGNIGF